MEESSLLLIVIVSVSVIVGVALIAIVSTLIYVYFFRRRRARSDVGRRYVGDTTDNSSSNWSTSSSETRPRRRRGEDDGRGIRKKKREYSGRPGHGRDDYFTFPTAKFGTARSRRQRRVRHRQAGGKFRSGNAGAGTASVLSRASGSAPNGRVPPRLRIAKKMPRGHAQTLDRPAGGGGAAIVTIGAGSESPMTGSASAAAPPVLSTDFRYNTMPGLGTPMTSHSRDNSIGQSELTDASSPITRALITVDGAGVTSETGASSSETKGTVLWVA